MNRVILIGRLTKDPDVRRTQDGKCIASYTLAVDRRGKNKDADFISCKAWEGRGEFAEQYLHKGMKIAVTGHIQTGKYTDKDGKTVYTTDVIVEDHEFCEKKEDGEIPAEKPAQESDFVTVPEDMQMELPFR